MNIHTHKQNNIPYFDIISVAAYFDFSEGCKVIQNTVNTNNLYHRQATYIMILQHQPTNMK